MGQEATPDPEKKRTGERTGQSRISASRRDCLRLGAVGFLFPSESRIGGSGELDSTTDDWGYGEQSYGDGAYGGVTT